MLGEQLLVELGLEDPVVIFIVHLLNDALPLPILNEALARKHCIDHANESVLRLLRVLLSKECAEQGYHRFFDRLLNEAELFITL